METVRFGDSGLKVSPACLGTMTFGRQADEPTAREIVRVCLDAGVNFFDTANVYNGGDSEEILGRALRGMRDQVVISSKVFGRMGDGPNDGGLSRRHILAAVEGSLRRLDTDYLDLYLLHQPDYTTPLEETLSALEHLVRSGKVRYVGCSNYASWQLVHAHWIADRRGFTPLTAAQPMYNLLARGIEQEFLPACQEFGVGVMVYNPLAGGLLTGKYRRREVESGARFDLYRMYRDRYWHVANFDAVETLAHLADALGISLLGFSLRWCFQHPAVHATILGASRPEQIRESLAVFEKTRGEMELPAETLEACDAVWAESRAVAPQYNR